MINSKGEIINPIKIVSTMMKIMDTLIAKNVNGKNILRIKYIRRNANEKKEREK